MKVGFSLSPGGLLLPYHLGALASLSDHGYIADTTALAGSSAGAIAVASVAAGVAPLQALEASVRVSSKLQFNPLFVPSGQLLPSLQQELQTLLPWNAHDIINQRQGITALAHREIFPRNKSVMVTQFQSRSHLMDSICDSSMFPYFLTNTPAKMTWKSRSQEGPRVRITVDGMFACPWQRIGCPEFGDCLEEPPTPTTRRNRPWRRNGNLSSNIGAKRSHSKSHSDNNNNDTINKKKAQLQDRTVLVSVFPTEFLSLTTTHHHDLIGPPLEANAMAQAMKLVRLATQAPFHATELYDLYEQGQANADDWIHRDQRRQQRKAKLRLRKRQQQQGQQQPS